MAIIHGTRWRPGSDDLKMVLDGTTTKASKPVRSGCISIRYVDGGETRNGRGGDNPIG